MILLGRRWAVHHVLHIIARGDNFEQTCIVTVHRTAFFYSLWKMLLLIIGLSVNDNLSLSFPSAFSRVWSSHFTTSH